CAELGLIRERGYAFDCEEHEPGIICVATPILTKSHSVMAAISVTSSTSRTTLENLEKHAPEMRKVSQQIASEAEYWRFPVDQKSARTVET
ncbi:MAG: IclR family transcriptional regulator C-terminal domain-containing protein, partial [Halocynthiibacter sp.]